MFTLHVCVLTLLSGGGGEAVTTVWDQVSTFVSITPLNIFHELLREFPAEFVATKTGLFDEVSRQFHARVFGDKKTDIFEGKSGHLQLCFVAKNRLFLEMSGQFPATFVAKQN